jgi:hypothetical protein
MDNQLSRLAPRILHVTCMKKDSSDGRNFWMHLWFCFTRIICSIFFDWVIKILLYCKKKNTDKDLMIDLYCSTIFSRPLIIFYFKWWDISHWEMLEHLLVFSCNGIDVIKKLHLCPFGWHICNFLIKKITSMPFQDDTRRTQGDVLTFLIPHYLYFYSNFILSFFLI